jgi:tetratricopeptide (TPR) repeat protein
MTPMTRTRHQIVAGLLVCLLTGAVAHGQAPQSNPTPAANAYYHFARAQMLEADNDWDGAVAEYEAALALDPTNSEIYSEIAAAYARQNQWRAVVDYASRAINVDPDNLDAHRLLGSVYTSLLTSGNNEEVSTEYVALAIEELEHVVRLSPDDTDAYLMLGRLYRFSGQPERAAEVYRDFLRVEPTSEEGVISLAELQMSAGNVGEAIGLLEEFTLAQPEADPAWIVLGEAYVQVNALDMAVVAFRMAIDLGREEVEIREELARILFVSSRWDEAAEEYENLVRIDGEDPVHWLRLGQIERERRNFAESRTYLQRAERIVPGSTDIGFAIALLDRDEGNFEDAIARLRTMLDGTARPNSRYTEGERGNRRLFLTHVALLHTMLEQYEEAVAAFEEMKAYARERDGSIDAYIVDTYRAARQPDRALEKAESSLIVFPDNRQLQLQRADLLGQTGRIEEGIAALDAMLDGTDDYQIYSAMVSIYEGAEEFDDAHEVLDIMIDEFERNREQTHFMRGALYERNQMHDDAESAFREALDINPDNPAVLNYLGYMLADQNEKLEEALEMIQKAVDSDPINGAYLDSLGWVYYRLGRLELAEEYLNRAIMFASTDPTLHEHLGDLYRQLGRLDEAGQAYERSLELAEDPDERESVQQKLDQVQ